MGIFLVACAALGLLCVCANLLEMIGKVVVATLKYVISPVLIFMLVMLFIYGMSRGGV